MSYTVLFVCTGNVCRSPAAERLLRGAVKGHDVRVESAGTGALVGEPISDPMADLLRAHGADPDGFAARQLTAPILRAADVVITMTHTHRAEVVTLVPAAVQRTFVLGELADMLRQVDNATITRRTGPDPTVADRLAAAFSLAKHHVAPGEELGGDVDDPYGRSKQVYARSFDQILDGVGPLRRLASTS